MGRSRPFGGWGAAYRSIRPPVSFFGGACSPLPGPDQTVPRSELFSMIVVCSRAVAGACLHFPSDSLLTVQGVRDIRRTGAEADLWHQLWLWVAVKQLTVSARWVKAHGIEKPHFIDKFKLSLVDVCGNGCADALADIAASDAELNAVVVNRYEKWVERVEFVQRRLVAIALHVVREHPRSHSQTPPQSQLRIPTADFDWFALRSSHALHRSLGSRVSCLVCHTGASGATQDVFKWMLSPCSGPPVSLIAACQPVPSDREIWLGGVLVHPSHRLIMHKGLYACELCGATGSSKIRLLRGLCPQQLIASGPRDLQRIRAGVLPWGRDAWPTSPHSVRERGRRIVLDCSTAHSHRPFPTGGRDMPPPGDSALSPAQARIAAVVRRVRQRLGVPEGNI